MEKETIADLCERLRKSGESDCLSIAHEWGPNCVNVSDCDACQKAVYDSIADRIEAAHQREMHELTNVINLSNRIFRDGGVIRATDRRREVVKSLKEYREHPPVRDVDGLIVEDTYSVGEVEGIVIGKEVFTTGEYIDALISLIDTSNQPDSQSDAPESEEDAESVASKDEIRDFDDTRERLESEIDEWCAEHFNSSFSGGAFNLILEWLDRQTAITERNCRAEYDDMRDYLQEQVDRLEAQVDAFESESERLKMKVSNQRRELDTYQIMYDVEAVAQLKREKKRYKGMYNAEHQTACNQMRRIDSLTKENEAMRQALRDLGDILE